MWGVGGVGVRRSPFFRAGGPRASLVTVGFLGTADVHHQACLLKVMLRL